MSDSPVLPPVLRDVDATFRALASAAPAGTYFAPGRINLLGAHLDYNGGDVLPLAVDLGVYVAVRPRADGRVRLASANEDGVVEIALDAIGEVADPSHGWASYPLGVLRTFRDVVDAADRLTGIDAVFGGDVPIASGLSSSAAIEVAFAGALDDLVGADLEPEDIARLAHRAETGYVGLRCGIMDQFASALGRPDHVLLLHCGKDVAWEHVPAPAEAFVCLVMDTRKPRALQSSLFNQRVEECSRAHEVLRRSVRDLPVLAAYTAADLEAAGDALDDVLRRRARHVVNEMVRIGRGVAALRDGDVAGLGRELDASHASTATDYEVSCDELDVITDLAREVDGVLGARLTGAGFGGCAVALVVPDAVADVAAHVAPRYAERFGVEPAFHVLRPGGGPRRLTDRP